MCIDALVCSFLGRPRATVSDDFDLDLPLDCDDEYWETPDPASNFLQPVGKPSKVPGFIAYVKLIEILEYAQRTLYAVNQSKRFRGPACGQNDEDVVTHLDSELNQWFDHIPDHLKWTSVSPCNVFYEQSAVLHACYHHVRVVVHRPFIPLPKRPSSLPFPSLTICTNAARSCAHILETQSQHGTYLPFPQVQFAIFTSAIVLLLSYWTNMKSSRHPRDLREDAKNVQDCISVLSALEERWTPAGRMSDIIRELCSYGNVPLTAPSAQANLERKSDDARLDVPLEADGRRGAYHVPGQGDMLKVPQDSAQWSWEDGTQNTSGGPALDSAIGGDDWWGNANEHDGTLLQFPEGQDLPSYGDPSVLYLPQSHGNAQWPIMMAAGEIGMDVSDVAMLWLQQPQNAWTWEDMQSASMS